jgi:hypothetical protein
VREDFISGDDNVPIVETVDEDDDDGPSVDPAKPVLFGAEDLAAADIDPSELKLPTISPEDLIGVTFLRENSEGMMSRATVLKKIMDHDAANHQKIKFLIKLGNGDLEELISYNELSDLI